MPCHFLDVVSKQKRSTRVDFCCTGFTIIYVCPNCMPWITRQQWSPNITKVTCKWPLHDTKIAPFWGMILEGVGCTWKHRIKYYSTVIMCILLYVILYDFVFFSSWQTQKVEFADWHVSLRSKVGFEWWVSGWRRHHGTLQPNAYCPDLSWIEGLGSSELECKCIVQKNRTYTQHVRISEPGQCKDLFCGEM